MFLNLFRRDPLLDETTRQWIHEVFAWALRHQGPGVFFRKTDLVLPTPEYFPGRASSVHGMAQLMFESVRRHAGLDHWPCHLLEPGALTAQPYPRHAPGPAYRARKEPAQATDGAVSTALFSYSPELVGNPEALIATFARDFAQHVAASAPEAPPGGRENWPHVTELVSVFMGFGLMLANTAFSVRVNRCGSCQGPAAERSGYLSRADLTYALALFCRLKDIPAGQARRHLKAALRPVFRRALAQIDRHPQDLETLKATAPAVAGAPAAGVLTLPR
ncbi:hypothetical protein TVNIR_3196 [Thioalkalivibrio nitratireducens DSM 14787]|uniref:Uncharacterized protein n=1 Tax=Thioalkalivibrio nitratireducens (strain DSM 14787 / UNIQEM 213 / ALEN2) TaxID=1255043 RepID=L0E0L6_THIND|nr:hypothetical protein [Thioalkalivibrio nitratireducens]AGA34833.1 hypothetical protein TVNIR_3196 [Thioalkalivibrio nitratireducens DSM 14787]